MRLEPHASAHGVQSSADDKSDWTTTGRINQVGCVAIMWLWSHKPSRREEVGREGGGEKSVFGWLGVRAGALSFFWNAPSIPQ